MCEKSRDELEKQPEQRSSDISTASQKLMQEAAYRKRSDSILSALAEGTSSALGVDFFASLVRTLAQSLGARYAFVAEHRDSPVTRCKTVAFWSGEELVENIEFDVSGTPCEQTVTGKILWIPRELQRLFPEDTHSVEMNAQSYVGCPLITAKGQIIGHMGVLDTAPIQEDPSLKPVIQIFAARAAAELERIRTEKSLCQSKEKFRLHFKNDPTPTYIWQKKDNDFVLTDLNDAAVGFTNGQAQCVVGNKLSELYAEVPFIQQDISRCFLDHKPITRKMEYSLRSTGKTRSLLAHYVYVPPDLIIVHTEDLTKRIEVEQRLREEKDLTSAIRNNDDVLVVVLDREGRVRKYNRAAERISGYSFAEIEGKYPWETFLPPEQAQVIRSEAFEALVNNPQRMVGHYTNEWVSKNGARRLIEWNNTILHDAEGRTEFVVSIGIDITERERAQEQLRENKTRLLETQRLAQIGSWRLDMKTGSLEWSDTIFEIFEIDKTRFGATYEAFLNTIHPDDREFVDSAYTQSVQNRTPYSLTHRLLMPDGRIKHVQEHCETVYDDQGEPLYSQGTIQDVTDRKQREESIRASEQKLRQLIDSCFGYIGLFDLEGTLIEANLAPLKAAGLTRDDVIGRPFWETYWWSFSPEVQLKLRDAMERAAAGKTVRYETPVRMKDDARAMIDIAFGPLRDLNGQVTAIAGYGVDITDRKEHEEMIRKQRRDLEHASRLTLVGQMIAAISHEINQPLAAAANYIEAGIQQLTLKGSGHSEAISRIREAQVQTLKAGSIIKRMLTFLRRNESDISTFDVSGPVIDALAMNDPEARMRSVALHSKIQSDAPMVRADRIQIQQVVCNLIRNAIESVDESGRERREVLVTTTFDDSHRVMVAVDDTGSGVRQEIRDHLFEAFHSNKKEGLGLGLWISQSIIREYGGDIILRSSSPEGSRFEFWLPTIEAARASSV